MEKRLKNIEDGYKWAKETAQALRSGKLSAVDMDALINEIESVYTRMELQLSDYLEDAFAAKLWLDFVDADDHDSEVSMVAALTELSNLFWAAPTVREALTETVIGEAWADARLRVAAASAKPTPEACPYDRQAMLKAISDLEFGA